MSKKQLYNVTIYSDSIKQYDYSYIYKFMSTCPIGLLAFSDTTFKRVSHDKLDELLDRAAQADLIVNVTETKR